MARETKEKQRGKDSGTCGGRSHQAERWRKKSGRRERKSKEEDEVQKRRWWKKSKEVKDAQKRCKYWEKFRKWLFLLLIMEQNWLSVSAAAEGPQRRTEAVNRMQQKVQIKECRWREKTPKRWKQPKGEDRTDMKKEARILRCTLLNRSTWSTEEIT